MFVQMAYFSIEMQEKQLLFDVDKIERNIPERECIFIPTNWRHQLASWSLGFFLFDCQILAFFTSFFCDRISIMKLFPELWIIWAVAIIQMELEIKMTNKLAYFTIVSRNTKLAPKKF